MGGSYCYFLPVLRYRHGAKESASPIRSRNCLLEIWNPANWNPVATTPNTLNRGGFLLQDKDLPPCASHPLPHRPYFLLKKKKKNPQRPHDEKDLFMFDLKGSKGAAMVTRHPIHRKDSNSLNDNPRLFDEIFKRINSPQGIHPVLVSGFDAVKDFEVVSYPNSDGGSFKPKRPITENMFKSLPPPFRGKWCFQFAPHIHRDSSAEFDQCLFVRYHTLRHKGGTSRIPRVLRGGAGPHDLGSGDNQGGAFPELTVQSSAQPTIGIDEDTGRPLGLPAGDASSGSSGVIKGRVYVWSLLCFLFPS